MTELTDTEKESLRREIGPPTDRDRKWRPMVSAAEVRALLDECDALTARLARVEALADEWDALGDTDSAFWWSTLATHLRAALAAPTPDEVQPRLEIKGCGYCGFNAGHTTDEHNSRVQP